MIPKPDRNSQGSSKESRSLLVSADRRMVGCHPMANGHGSNEPETTRTEPKGTDTNRKTYKPTRGNDGGRLAGAVENRRNSNETHPEKRNSRMTVAPGGEPGSVILANSRRRTNGFRHYSSRVTAKGLRAIDSTLLGVIPRCRDTSSASTRSDSDRLDPPNRRRPLMSSSDTSIGFLSSPLSALNAVRAPISPMKSFRPCSNRSRKGSKRERRARPAKSPHVIR